MITNVLWVILCMSLIPSRIPISHATEAGRVNLIIMSQCWAPTVCLVWRQENNKHTCTINSPGSWTMHGIWVAGEVEGYSIHCNNASFLDIEQIKPIEPDLDRLWTNVEASSEATRYTFWSHEWTKHGTCFASLESLNTQRKYFTQGLKWIQEHSMSSVLNKAGILPSDWKGYHFEEIFNATLTKYEVKLQFVCVSVGQKQFLVDILICFNGSLELADCEHISRKPNFREYDIEGRSVITNCQLDTEIMYLRTLENISHFLINPDPTEDKVYDNTELEVV